MRYRIFRAVLWSPNNVSLRDLIFHDDPTFSILKSVRQKNLRRVIFAHLNINSLRKKIDGLVDQIQRNVDILVISETKLDESPSEDQFKIPGIASPFRRDQNKFRGR